MLLKVLSIITIGPDTLMLTHYQLAHGGLNTVGFKTRREILREFQEVVNDLKCLPPSNLKGKAPHKLPGHQNLCWLRIQVWNLFQEEARNRRGSEDHRHSPLTQGWRSKSLLIRGRGVWCKFTENLRAPPHKERWIDKPDGCPVAEADLKLLLMLRPF